LQTTVIFRLKPAIILGTRGTKTPNATYFQVKEAERSVKNLKPLTALVIPGGVEIYEPQSTFCKWKIALFPKFFHPIGDQLVEYARFCSF
jgi:hypothetical protein